MSFSRRLLGMGVALVFALAALGGWQWWSRESGPVVLWGNVDIRQVELSFRVEGRIARVLVDEGAQVAPGQELAHLETDILTLQKDQAAALLEQQKAALLRLERGYRTEEIAQARAAVAASQAVADNALVHLRRVTAMRSSNAISQKDLDNARAGEREARARLASDNDRLRMLLAGYREEEVLAQKAAVDSASAALELAQTRLNDARLLAPQGGVVLVRAREAGAIVQAGQTVYTLALTRPVWLRAYVDEPRLGRIKPGMSARVLVDAAPGRSFAGTVGFISPVAEFTPKTVETDEVRTALVYRVRIQAEDPENVMRQGMPVTVILGEEPAP